MKTKLFCVATLLFGTSNLAHADGLVMHGPPIASTPIPQTNLSCGQVVKAADGSQICVNFDAQSRLSTAYKIGDPTTAMALKYVAAGGSPSGACQTVTAEFRDATGTYLTQSSKVCTKNGYASYADVSYVASSRTYDVSLAAFNVVPGKADIRAVYHYEPTRYADDDTNLNWNGTYNLSDESLTLDPRIVAEQAG